MELECLVDVVGTAEWRRQKAEQYPHDDRNREAAEVLDRLAKEMPALEGSDLHLRIEDLREETESEKFLEAVSLELREVGFHSWPQSGRDLLEAIVERLTP